ncbi:MAG: EamA family transporter [Sphaerochaeta associata]|jgi:drug/metabolite transporter (DMT)-like permease|uniref:DMT family transporter n=1 Tax=Sphaerochaeta associata TaxID=1129264 RepID=UPI002B21EF06|nr:EamA family transporter [Sphaerochaeta associata]MEA5108355.1 EamA family transporter [Sphaerochaeta associata]
MQTPLLRYIAALLLFGTNGVVASHIQADSLTIVFFRTTLGLVGLLAATLVLHKHKKPGTETREVLLLLLSGIYMGLGWASLYKAYTLLGVGLSSLLYYTGPIMVLAVSIMQKKEPYTHRLLFACLLVVMGMLFLKEDSALQGTSVQGMLYGLFSACMYACMVLTNRRVSKGSGLVHTLWQLGGSTAVVTVALLLSSGFTYPQTTVSWLYILLLGLGNTALGCFLYFSAIPALPLKSVAILGYLEPVSAVLFSILFLQESFGPKKLIGCFCIVMAAVWTERVKTRSYPEA